MKKLFITLAVSVFAIGSAAAQNYDTNGFELASTSKGVESHLRVAFPMFFGFATPLGADASTFPKTKFVQNFYYGLEPVSIRFSSDTSPFMFSLGLRCSFVDFSLEDTQYTYREGLDKKYHPSIILLENTKYDGTKSKIHASYLGVPARFYFTAGKAKVFAGASAEYMIHGWTKYKFPKYREDANNLFNRFRATTEVGFGYGAFGLFANYTFTPILADNLSQAGTLTFGITFGM